MPLRRPPAPQSKEHVQAENALSRHLLNAVQTPGFGTVQGADKVPYFAHLFGLGRPRVFAHKHVEKHGGALELSNGANGARVSARFRFSPQK